MKQMINKRILGLSFVLLLLSLCACSTSTNSGGSTQWQWSGDYCNHAFGVGSGQTIIAIGADGDSTHIVVKDYKSDLTEYITLNKGALWIVDTSQKAKYLAEFKAQYGDKPVVGNFTGNTNISPPC